MVASTIELRDVKFYLPDHPGSVKPIHVRLPPTGKYLILRLVGFDPVYRVLVSSVERIVYIHREALGISVWAVVCTLEAVASDQDGLLELEPDPPSCRR